MTVEMSVTTASGCLRCEGGLNHSKVLLLATEMRYLWFLLLAASGMVRSTSPRSMNGLNFLVATFVDATSRNVAISCEDPSPDDNVRVCELYQKTAITEWEDVPNIIYVSSTHLLHQHVEDDEDDEEDE